MDFLKERGSDILDYLTIYDSDYMNMDLKFAYRYLTNTELLEDLHDHNFYEYFLIVSGSVTHMINGREEILKAGDLVFIRDFDRHHYHNQLNQKCEMISVSFSREYFDAGCRYLGEPLRAFLLNPSAHSLKIYISSYNLSSYVQKHDFFNFRMPGQELILKFKLLLIEILSLFLLDAPKTFPDQSRQKLENMLEQMNSQENIEEGLPAMLRITGFSHGHLCRVMKEALHTTPKQYLTDLRMTYASNLLTNSTMDILSISLKVGYTSLSHFITKFKESFGMAPLKYRQTH